MLHRGPVVITSLEEDFKKIGLISETTESVEGEEGADGDEGEGEGIEEGARILRRLGKGIRRLLRTKRTPPSVKAKSRRRYARTKTKVKMARKRAMRKPVKRRRAKWAAQQRAKRAKKEGAESPIANLIEEVQDIVSSIDAPKGTDDAIKSFANIAIISDLLANTFNEWSETLDESYSDQETYDILAEAAESLADLAEAAAEVASALKEGLTIEGEETVEDLFKEYMEDMLEGMELYNDAIAEMDTMHGKAGNIGQPGALKKKGKVVNPAEEVEEDGEPVSEQDDDEDEGEDDEDEGDDEEGDEEEDDAEESKKRPSKR